MFLKIVKHPHKEYEEAKLMIKQPRWFEDTKGSHMVWGGAAELCTR